MIIWLGLIILNLLASGPSGSSLIWTSDFIATGRQLHVGSMVTSSNSELVTWIRNQTVKVRKTHLYAIKDSCFLWSRLTFEWRSGFPTCTGPPRAPLTTLFYCGEKREILGMLGDTSSWCTAETTTGETNTVSSNKREKTYLQTGHRHVPRSQFSCKYDSKSKHCENKEKK